MTRVSLSMKNGFLFLILLASTAAAQTPRVQVEVVTDEARAVLLILDLDSAATEADWQRLFASEGYVRLKQREAEMQRAFTDSSFRAFVTTPALRARKQILEMTLAKWNRIDATKAAARALSYLPADAVIRARIYPVIKPRTNSFVFDAATNPAIFLYLDPNVGDVKFENTLTHELHHIGYSSVCKGDHEGALGYMGTFGEGRAVLAAAGTPLVHPHAISPDSERVAWDRDYARVISDMRRMEKFFTAVADKKLTEEEAVKQWFQFVSTDSIPQGAFYTVGYLMSRTIEMELGRPRLVASLCDPLMFLRDYNRAAARIGGLALWSKGFLERMSRERPKPQPGLPSTSRR
jgi:hypothetical protein